MDKEKLLRASQMVDAYQEFSATDERLHADVEFFSKIIAKEDLQVWRRGFVRALFAMIEGVCYRMQQIALKASHLPRVEISVGEIQVLSDTSFELDEQGKVIEKTLKTSLRRIIRFAFREYAKVHMANYELDVSREDEWGAFLRSIKVRDRLMHPKRAADLDVSDDEMLAMKRTFDWFMKNLTTVQKMSLTSLEEDVKKYPPESATPASDSNAAGK